ncbi:hypothetical protein EGK39_25245 [Klebsiella oxytoca]|nr:hypothetical protein F0332_11240 [Klebsiella grimontii]PEN24380.1 hypothetical protein CMQ96_11315 [Klebsiella sp. MBT K-1]RRZ69806.1 hypothetical protein EGK39_25245 [Klebsiella oxytoca]
MRTNKLKRRRWRRIRDDLAWYKEEAKDLHNRLMELADEVAKLRSQILTVPMPVIVPFQIYSAVTGEPDHQLCKKCNDGLRGGCSACSFSGK